MISLGVNVKWLQVQMGHSSIRVTLDTYGHLLKSVEEDSPERLWGLVFEKPREGDGNGEPSNP